MMQQKIFFNELKIIPKINFGINVISFHKQPIAVLLYFFMMTSDLPEI